MTQDDVNKKLSSLTPRQREVLNLFCAGLIYKDIGRELFISGETVKSHMGNIYAELDLIYLEPAERRRKLREEYCPALRKSYYPPEDVNDQEEPDQVPEEVERMVEEDEKAIVLVEPEPIVPIVEPEPSPQPRRFGWLAVGIIIGVLIVIGIFYIFDRFRDSGEEQLTALSSTPIVLITEISVVVTPTPEQELPSSTPIIQTVVVIVTATAPPFTNTPVATDTPLPSPTATVTPTPLPTDTPPGTVLEEGQTWYQSGLALTAKDFCIVECLPESLEVTFVLESFLDQDILLPEILGEDLPLEFDTGETYLPWTLGIATIELIPSEQLKPNQPLEWTWVYREDWNPNWWTPIGADTRDFSLIVKRIGDRIVDARWFGEIPR